MIVKLLFSESHNNLGGQKLCMASLYGAKTETAFSKKIILVGASHMRRLEATLAEDGIKTEHVVTKH
jgi:hypothetical protein